MENFPTQFSTTSTTIIPTIDTTMMNNLMGQMGIVQNRQVFINEGTNFLQPNLNTVLPHTQFYSPPQFFPTHESLQIPYTYLMEQPAYPFLQAGIQIGVPASFQGSGFLQANVALQEQERKAMATHETKLARVNRKVARRRSIYNKLVASASPYSTEPRASRVQRIKRKNISKDSFNICTSDNNKLRVLLKKELRHSDVGALGRIVLPKREAEENLPHLTDKGGLQVVVRDAFSNQEWRLKFKFWCNNRSRMYVLENTGEFVRKNGIDVGDSLTLYEDENENLYFSIQKVEKPEEERPVMEKPIVEEDPSNKPKEQTKHNEVYLYPPISSDVRDEEEAALALLIKQLEHKEEMNSLDTMLSLNGASLSRNMNLGLVNDSNHNQTNGAHDFFDINHSNRFSR